MITREFSDGTNKRLGQLFFFFVIVCLGLTILAYSTEREFVCTAVLSKGEVIGVQRNRTWPTIKYSEATGREITFRPSSRSSTDEFMVGEVVEVIHNNKVPSVAKLNRWTHLWIGTLGASAFCIIFSIFSALTLSGKARWGPLKQIRVIF